MPHKFCAIAYGGKLSPQAHTREGGLRQEFFLFGMAQIQ